ncbi:MAG TPA: EF-hand domain-containing protein [Usitatibacter sp.]|nr:EF-hand domain-containing protein [Usitatibacter sp.]
MKSVLALTALALVSASTLVLADPGAGHPRGAMIERLKAADTNGDGMLSRQEAAALPRLAERFDAIDANRDGLVTFDELRAAHQAHRGAKRGASADANGDGKVTREEFLARAAARFDRLDANKDGVITQEEFRAGRHGHGRGAKQ